MQPPDRNPWGMPATPATLLYRLAAYWLPIPAGGVAYLLFRHRYH